MAGALARNRDRARRRRFYSRPDQHSLDQHQHGFLRFARVATGSAVWIGERPPQGVVFPAQRYALAVADAAMAGAHWIIAIDPDLERGLHAWEAQAMEAWRQIETHVQYWKNPEWRRYRPYANSSWCRTCPAAGFSPAAFWICSPSCILQRARNRRGV